MRLPGGLIEQGQRLRDAAFRPVSGALELALAEGADAAPDTPRAVTTVLSLALAELGGASATPQRVDALCVADRQFLMRALAGHLAGPTPDSHWRSECCGHCGDRFDIELDESALPVQEAAAGYPWAEWRPADGPPLRFRLPVGADLPELAQQQNEELASAWLLQRLAAQPLPEHRPPTLIAEVESALEQIAPAVVLQVQACCPACGSACVIELDPYRVLDRRSDALLHEVHRLAWHYHWSEAEILALPRARRQHYLRLIDRARGLAE